MVVVGSVSGYRHYRRDIYDGVLGRQDPLFVDGQRISNPPRRIDAFLGSHMAQESAAGNSDGQEDFRSESISACATIVDHS